MNVPTRHFLVKRSRLSTLKMFAEFYQPESLELLSRLRDGIYHAQPLTDISLRLFDGPFGSDRKIDMYQSSGIPYMRVKDVLPEGIDQRELMYISQEKHEAFSRSKVVPGNVLMTIAGRVGTAAVFPEGLVEGNITGHIVGIELPDTMNPHYLAAFINSELGKFQVARWAHRTTRPELNLFEVGQILIPVPPRPVQDRIAEIMQDAYVVRQKKLEKIDNLLEEVNRYVFRQLSIAPENVSEETRFLKSSTNIRGSRFDVAFNMGFHKLDPYPDLVTSVDKVADFPKATNDPSKSPCTTFEYVDIASIDIVTGEIGEPTEIVGSEAPSRARQVVHTNDIIVSTVRPTRGATALVPQTLDGVICSTGFTIVRAKNGVLPEYLHIALRLSTTLEQFGRRSAGSSYPAILENDIKETLIPVPDISIQKVIVDDVSRRRTEARRLRNEADKVVADAKARVERMILGEETV